MRTKPHKFSESNKIWFTGCTHIFHKQPFIWQKRGYESIIAHAKGVRDKINEVVAHDDIMFHLGDSFLNSTPEEVNDWLSGVKCQNIHYISGNHESSTKKLFDNAKASLGIYDLEVYPVRHRNIIFLGPQVEIEIDGKLIILSHFPLAIWNKSQHGSWNIHSHCHGSFAESLPDFPTFKRLDVGWDVFSAPINYVHVREIMSRKQIKVLDHHDSKTT